VEYLVEVLWVSRVHLVSSSSGKYMYVQFTIAFHLESKVYKPPSIMHDYTPVYFIHYSIKV